MKTHLIFQGIVFVIIIIVVRDIFSDVVAVMRVQLSLLYSLGSVGSDIPLSHMIIVSIKHCKDAKYYMQGAKIVHQAPALTSLVCHIPSPCPH